MWLAYLLTENKYNKMDFIIIDYFNHTGRNQHHTSHPPSVGQMQTYKRAVKY